MAIDRGIPPLVHGRDVAPLAAIMAAFFVAVAVQAVTTRAFILEIGRFGEGVVSELRRRLFAHFQRLPVAFHERYTSGRVISRQTSDIDSISDLFEEGLDSLVSAVFSLLLVGVGMLLLDWPLALVVLAGFGPLAVLTLWFRRESATAYRRSREAIADVIVAFVETFGGIRAVQAFRRERRNEEIFSALNGRNAAATLRSMRLIAVYSPGITLVGNLATGAVLLYGGLRVADGDIKVGVLATFLLYLQRFFDPLQDLSQFYNTFQSAGAALEKISGVLEEPLGVPEPEVPAELPPRQGAGRELWLRSVRFGYRETIVLPDMDLRIPAGPDGGAGRRDRRGEDHRGAAGGPLLRPAARAASCSTAPTCGTWRAERLRSEVVLVTQENFLFTGSIADNIELGKPGASRAEITAAAKAIGADAFITALPGGYDARGRQARRPAVRGPAPAHLVRAGVPGRARRAGARRGDLAARPARRAGRAGGAAHDPGRAHRADHRAPAVHGGDRRPGAGDERGRDRRGRAAGSAAGGQRPVLCPACQLAVQPRVGTRPRGRDCRHAAAAAAGS